MPRNSQGLYTLPLPPVISGQTVEATWANQTLADVELALTNSLDRDDNGNMQTALKVVDGTTAAPGLSFVNEANTGLHRAGPGDFYFSVLGQDYLRITNENGVQFSTDGVVWESIPTTTEYETYVDEREVTAVNWTVASNTLTLVKTVGNLTQVIDQFNDLTVDTDLTVGNDLTVTNDLTVGAGLTVNDRAYLESLAIEGPVNQISEPVAGNGTNTMVVDTTLANRWRASNNASPTVTLTIDKPTGPAAMAGGPVEEYTVEGTILFTNGGTPGIVDIAGVSADEILGSNPVTGGTKYLLTYVIHRLTGDAYDEIYIWSAV